MPQGQEFMAKREREREGGGECVREMENFAYERETKQTAAPATYFYNNASATSHRCCT
jgi:hypothetical protein